MHTDSFNLWNHRRSQFRPTKPTFTSLSTDEASVVKLPCLGAQAGVRTRNVMIAAQRSICVSMITLQLLEIHTRWRALYTRGCQIWKNFTWAGNMMGSRCCLIKSEVSDDVAVTKAEPFLSKWWQWGQYHSSLCSHCRPIVLHVIRHLFPTSKAWNVESMLKVDWSEEINVAVTNAQYCVPSRLRGCRTHNTRLRMKLESLSTLQPVRCRLVSEATEVRILTQSLYRGSLGTQHSMRYQIVINIINIY